MPRIQRFPEHELAVYFYLWCPTNDVSAVHHRISSSGQGSESQLMVVCDALKVYPMVLSRQVGEAKFACDATLGRNSSMHIGSQDSRKRCFKPIGCARRTHVPTTYCTPFSSYWRYASALVCMYLKPEYPGKAGGARRRL